MKKEHQVYMLLQHLNPDQNKRTNLATFVNTEIQKPVKGSEYGIILPKQLDDFDLTRSTTPTSH